ncbi:MAG: c-type cytochrome biogenesis protein CcmI [Gammaproteobacteria bacterium]
MTLFWIVAGLLIVAALCFVLPPLLNRRGDAAGPTRVEVNRALYRQRLAELRRDVDNDLLTRAQYERARLDLERELLAEVSEDTAPAARPARGGARMTAALVGIALPALAVLFYLRFSTGFDALDASRPQADPGRQPSIDEIARVIEARLEQNPDDRTGWIMLARVRTLMGRYAAASQAYAQADAVAKIDEPDLLAAYAQTLALSSDERFAGRPAALLKQALDLQPNNPQALWLAGWADYQRQDFAGAAARWERLQQTAPAERLEAFEDLPGRIAEARRRAGQAVDGSDTAARDEGGTRQSRAPSTRPASVTVAVSLAPALRQRAAPTDTVFVYAQAVDGPRMPLALARTTVAELPLEVTLDDSAAMAPAFRLSDVDEVNVLVRISKTGEAMPQSGDLLGEREKIPTREQARISITIDQVVP